MGKQWGADLFFLNNKSAEGERGQRNLPPFYNGFSSDEAIQTQRTGR
jgi:hypothetical protein